MASEADNVAAVGRGLGTFIREAGPAGVISLVSLLLVILGLGLVLFLPGIRADAFTGTQASSMQKALDERIAALARVVETHINSPVGHVGTVELLTELRTNQRNITATLDKIQASLERVSQSLNGR